MRTLRQGTEIELNSEFRDLLRTSEEFRQSFTEVIAHAHRHGQEAGRRTRETRRIAIPASGTFALCLLLGWYWLLPAPVLALLYCAAVRLHLLFDRRTLPTKLGAAFVLKVVNSKDSRRFLSAVLAQQTCEPPRAAEFVIAFLSKPEHREASIGDANERFQRDVSRFGIGRARLMYWADTARSIWPLIRQRLRRISITGILIALVTLALRR